MSEPIEWTKTEYGHEANVGPNLTGLVWKEGAWHWQLFRNDHHEAVLYGHTNTRGRFGEALARNTCIRAAKGAAA